MKSYTNTIDSLLKNATVVGQRMFSSTEEESPMKEPVDKSSQKRYSKCVIEDIQPEFQTTLTKATGLKKT